MDVIFMTGLIIRSAVSWRKKYSSLKMESTPPKQTNKPGPGREASEVGEGASGMAALDFCLGWYC